jgi:hypothetical protein
LQYKYDLKETTSRGDSIAKAQERENESAKNWGQLPLKSSGAYHKTIKIARTIANGTEGKRGLFCLRKGCDREGSVTFIEGRR